MYKVSLDAAQTDVDVIHITDSMCEAAIADSLAAEVVHVTVPITALEGEAGGTEVNGGTIDELQLRLSLCWNIFYRLGQLTGVPVERNTEISLTGLQLMLSEIEQILLAAGKQL